MKVNVKDVRAGKVNRDWLESTILVNEIFEKEPNNSTKLLEPFSIHMELTSVGEDVEVYGDFSAELSFSCDRCLCDASLKLKEKFHYILMPKKESEEELLEDEETELSYFEGDEIDLTELAVEQLMLSIPYKLLCKTGCKGICPKCGTNLNEETCKCSEETEYSFLAKELKKLKNKE
ncbi:MAG: DUF177 domain-containing protein [Proteobacteria bacterium]|nr:DUF177 domain-containing protein [Pseudomonadota bacterium]